MIMQFNYLAKTWVLSIALSLIFLLHNSCQSVESSQSTFLSGTIERTLREDFEQGQVSKSSYATSAVQFNSGEWLITDGLIGSTDADPKNGMHAIRIRNKGKLTMNFDVENIKQITINHATFGSDGPSSWQLWVSTNGGLNYSQVGKTLHTTSPVLTSVFFTVNTKSLVRFEIRKIGGGKNRIDIDDIIGNTLATPQEKQENKNSATTTDDSNLLLGNPSNAVNSIEQPENYLIDHKFYTASYSRKKAIPNWVSWHIGPSDLGNTKRLNNFRQDGSLPSGWYEADNTSYKDSGFDKGHNCPSGDRTNSTAANSSTFLMSNMIPQAPNNNQRTWEHLESYCRDQVKKGNEVYVIMGSYGIGGTGSNGYKKTIDNGRITVPARIWKIVIVIPNGNNDLQRINTESKLIAIDTPNDNNITPNWMNYICTVRDIEKATGYNLLSALPEVLQNKIELRKFTGGN